MQKFFNLLIIFTFSFFSIVNSQSVFKVEKTGGFARLQAMGANPYIVDPFNMTLNPAWAAYYDNFIMGDLGSTITPFGNDGTGQFIGANFAVTNQLTLGAFLTRNDFNGRFSIANLDPGDVVGEMNGIIGFGALVPLNNNLELIASLKTSGGKLGFGIAYAASSSEFNPAGGQSTTASASQIGINLGYIGNLAPGFLLDLGFSLSLPRASYSPPNVKETSVSQTNLGINARAFYNLDIKFKLVPALTFSSSTGSADIASGTTVTSTDLPSTSVIIFGVGIMYSSSDFLFAGGPAFATIGVTDPAVENIRPELTNTTTIFPAFNFGAEWKMLDWLYARFGYISVSGSVTSESAASSTTINETINTFYGPTGAFTGLGFRLGNLSIDATVNSDILRQGLGNIGGTGATFAYLSLSIELM